MDNANVTQLIKAAQEALDWFDEAPIAEIGAVEDAIGRLFPAAALYAAVCRLTGHDAAAVEEYESLNKVR